MAEPLTYAADRSVPVGLGETLWEEAVRRRFLPGWTGSDWRREGQTWRSIFFK